MKFTRRAYSKVMKRLRTDRDFIVLISGKEGSGKSTLAIQLAQIVNKKFNIETDVLYTFQDIIQRIETAQRYDTLVLDEAVEFAFSRNAMKREQKKVIQIFMQIRQKNICFIMLIPNLSDIDKYFKSWRADRWIDVIKRGEFISHEMLRNRYSGQVFWRPGYRDNFRKLNSEDWEKYTEVKSKAFTKKADTQQQTNPKKKLLQIITCPKCKSSYRPRKKNPVRCARCGKYL